MPTFDFQCQKCENVFEFSRPFGNKTMPACPKCGSRRTQKLLTPPTIQFKGSGFYKTDSARPSAPAKKKPEPKKPTENAAPAPDSGKKEAAKPVENKGK